MEIRQRVREVVIEDGWALVKIHQVPDRPGIAATIFGEIARQDVNVDMILQNASAERKTDLSFTVRQEDAARARSCVEAIRGEIQAGGVETLEGLAKVMLVGTGILTDPSYVGRMFRALADARVNVLAIGTSEIKISCLIRREDHQDARRALDAAFTSNAHL